MVINKVIHLFFMIKSGVRGAYPHNPHTYYYYYFIYITSFAGTPLFIIYLTVINKCP